MILRGKDGWPVELLIGRPITNAIRLLIHTSIRETWKRRKEGPIAEAARLLREWQQEMIHEPRSAVAVATWLRENTP